MFDSRKIRPARTHDCDAIWSMLKPVLREGRTYALPRDWPCEEALGYWLGSDKRTFVAEEDGALVGTFYLSANQLGGGGHVVNCGYVTAAAAQGRGVARAMCEYSQVAAKALGFAAMQFNCVVSSNERAVALWTALGFQTIGVVPGGFKLPEGDFVDALIMHKTLL